MVKILKKIIKCIIINVMKEFFDIKGKLNIIKNFEQFNQVITLTDAVSFCEQLGLEFSRGKIEVLMVQKDFVAVGNKLIEPLKKGGAEVSPLLIEDNSALHTSIKIKSDEEIAACVVIGDSDLLNFARYYASLNKVPCYAIPFTPQLEDLLKSYVLLKTQNLPAKIEVDCFKKRSI